jgi:hypothetical protein
VSEPETTHRSRAAVIGLVRLWFWPAGLVEAVYGGQGEAEVADLGEQAVQCGLVGERAGHGGLAAVVVDVEVSEPGRPVGVEDPVDLDLVAGGCSWAGHAGVPVRAGRSGSLPGRGVVMAVPAVVAVSGTVHDRNGAGRGASLEGARGVESWRRGAAGDGGGRVAGWRVRDGRLVLAVAVRDAAVLGCAYLTAEPGGRGRR